MDRIGFTALAVLTAFCFTLPAYAADDSDESYDTATIVAQCRTDHDVCRESIGFGVVVWSGNAFCAPKDMQIPTDVEVDGVLSWLEAHPQVHPESFGEASNVALESLYPCPRN